MPKLVTSADAREREKYLFLGLLVAAALATVLVYWRGLYGVFVFDDFANLPALGAYGPVDNWTAFTRYITSGTADPTGRPLALLSFLIDAHNWPADPFPFKRTNLILHVINGALLALLLRQLGRTVLPDERRRADVAAAAGAAIWMLHPLFVSTTLYVVQREAMLPATFCLLGLIGYVRGRNLAAAGRSAGAWLSASAIVGGTLLATLSKANGILIPLLAWTADALLLERSAPSGGAQMRRFRWVLRLVVVLPSVVLVAWLAWQAIVFSLHGVGPLRPWTLPQRLLTEARIVCNYLALLWLPHPYTAGLFNDAQTVSTGLFSPATTALSILFLGSLLGVAVAIRRLAPAWSFAIVFFFAGHLLESSVIPLELYYEHRNYLPAMPMFWPLALWLARDGAGVALRRTLLVAIPAVVAAMTFLNADLWGNPRDQALVWAAKNPKSPRAQAYAAAAERALGRPDRAAARMQSTAPVAGEDIQVAMNEIGAECEMGHVGEAALERTRDALRTTRTAGRLYFDWVGEAIHRVRDGTACDGLGAPEIRSLLAALDDNPNMGRYAGWRQDNAGLRAELALAEKDPAEALRSYDVALAAQPTASAALGQAAQLGAAGYPAEGLAHLDYFASLPRKPVAWHWSMAGVHEWLLERQHFMDDELAHLRGVLAEDLREKASVEPGTRPPTTQEPRGPTSG